MLMLVPSLYMTTLNIRTTLQLQLQRFFVIKLSLIKLNGTTKWQIIFDECSKTQEK